jgi:hypothetical protein
VPGGLDAGPARIALGVRWSGQPGADPALEVEGVGALELTARTQAGEERVHVGTVVLGVLPF